MRKGIIDAIVLSLFLSAATYAQVGGPGTVIVGGGGASVDPSAFALLAGDTDGQMIYGVAGEPNNARVSILEGVVNISAYGASGAEHGISVDYNNGVLIFNADRTASITTSNAGVGMAGSSVVTSFLGIQAGTDDVLVRGTKVRFESGQTPPTNANDPCTAGDTIDTATFHYYCAATNSWVRAPMAAW